MNQEYRQDVLDGISKKAKPKMSDFRARVIAQMDWDVGERTLSTVKRLGEAGLLTK